jgi:hypothetical protein
LDNWTPVLDFHIKDNHIHNSHWSRETIEKHLVKGAVDKSKYSLATTEFILNKGLEHLDTRNTSNYNSWKLEDLLPEHQKMVLEKFPNFNDPLAIVHKTSKNKQEVLNNIGGVWLDLKMLDNNMVKIRNEIDEDNIIHAQYFPGAPNYEERDRFRKLLDKKINGKYGENHKYDFENLAKEGDINKLKEKLPFADEEMAALSREHGYRTSTALSHSIGKIVMPQVMKIIYNAIKPYENDKFKILLQDNEIRFAVSYDDVLKDYREHRDLKHLEKEFDEWKSKIKLNWDEIIREVANIERGIDKPEFRKAISSYESHSRAKSYNAF